MLHEIQPVTISYFCSCVINIYCTIDKGGMNNVVIVESVIVISVTKSPCVVVICA